MNLLSLYNESGFHNVPEVLTQIEQRIAPHTNAKFHLEIFADEDDDCEGYAYQCDDTIYVALTVDSNVTLAHELVHVIQYAYGLEVSEDQAYDLEQEFALCLLP